MICIPSKVLVRVCYSRNELVYFPTLGIIVGEPESPVAQYAPGRPSPPASWIDGMAIGDHGRDSTVLS